jgi:hypothetical protein
VNIFLAKVQNVYLGFSNVVINEDVFVKAGDGGLGRFKVNWNFEDLVPNGVLTRLVGSFCAIFNSIVNYLDVGVHVAK